MHVQTGMVAPAFETEYLFGNSVSLSRYIGKTLLLSFFRNAACAICNLRVHQLIQRYPAYQRDGLEILAVFESPPESILQYVGKQVAPFPIIADPTARLYDLYDVEVSQFKVEETISRPASQEVIAEAAKAGFPLTKEEGSNFYRIPADFLIGPTGAVEVAHYARYVTDHLPFEVIEQHLRSAVR